MATFKESMKIATDAMSNYMYLHFYFGIIPAIISILQFNHIRVPSYLISNNNAIYMLILSFAILFAPATLWFILIKIFKNIHQLIIIPYFLIFYSVQAATLFYVLMFLIVGDDLDLS